jgi:UDP-glucose 4-epimerase
MDGVDGCFHLAAIASVERCKLDWAGTHGVNLTGTITIFQAIARQQADRPIPVVYASSAAIYGDCRTLPVTEDSPKQPSSAYGADKYGCELHANVAASVYGIPSTGLRFFNVYGPRQDPDSPYSGVISIFANRIRRGVPIDIFGDGSQTRDFVAVTDVVAAMISAMLRPHAGGDVFNVCTGQPTSILELAELVGSLCGKAAVPRFQPARAGEIKHSVGSTQAAAGSLGWSSATTLALGLRKTLDWMVAH